MKRRDFIRGAAALSTILLSGVGLAKGTKSTDACYQDADFTIFYPATLYEYPRNFFREQKQAYNVRTYCNVTGKKFIVVYHVKSLNHNPVPIAMGHVAVLADVVIVKTNDYKEIVVFKNKFSGKTGQYRHRHLSDLGDWGFNIIKVVEHIDSSILTMN